MAYRKNSHSIMMNGITAAAVSLVCLLLLAECKKEATQHPAPLPKVTVAFPLKQDVTYYLELTGNTQAVNTVQLVARVTGYLDKVFFKDGQIVKKGQLLFLIQQDSYIAALQQADGQVAAFKAQLDYAQHQLERYTELLPEKAAARSDMDNWLYQRDQAKANLEAAEGNRTLAKLNLDYTKVTAPFDGRIDRRLQDPGNLVGSSSSNTNLAQIVQIDPIYVYFTVSDADLARLAKATHGIPGNNAAMKWPVLVGLVSEEGHPHQGYIDFAATNISTSTGTLQMRGILSNPAGKIMPGLFARVRVSLESKIAMLVPATGVSNDQEGSYVLIVNEKNIVERRSVKTGPLEGGMRVIEEGLAENEKIIVSALLKARPGSQVSPQLENAATEGNR